MKKCIFYLVVSMSLIFGSCSNDKEVIQVAADYTNKNICTLFDKATIVKMKGSKENEVSIVFIKDKQQKLDFIADAAMGNYKTVSNRGRAYLSKVGTPEYETKAKNFLTADAINYFSQQAIQEGNEQEGFYVVSYTIEFGEEFDDQVSFNAVLSKDLKILNKAVDINVYKKHLEEATK